MEKEFRSGYAPVNGIRMYYEVHGTGGVPLVLLHGGGSTIDTTFGRVLPLFAAYGMVVATELQAHGRTGDRDAALTFEQDADDVSGLLQVLKIPQADVMGFSNGGSTAMQLAMRHPEKVRRLIVISSFYKREGLFPGFFDMMSQATLANMPLPLQQAFLKLNPDRDRLQVMHDKDRNRMLAFRDWADEDLRRIRAKTLLVAADHDVASPEHTAGMSKLIREASLMILPGTHGACIGEICTQPDPELIGLTVAVIRRFLA